MLIKSKTRSHVSDRRIYMSEKELLTILIDHYADLQRILKAEDSKKEVEYQLKLIKAKLESMGIITSDLNMD